MSALVLTVNPSAHATEMALFRGLELLRTRTGVHVAGELRGRRAGPFAREKVVRTFLDEAGVVHGGLAAVAVPGGTLGAIDGGTYPITEALLRDAERAGDFDPANGAAALADRIAAEWGCAAFVVDPESVDERDTLARLSQPCCLATPRVPALVTRAAARRHAHAVNRPVESLRLIVAHLGKAVTLSAHRGGRMVEVVELWEKHHPCGHVCDADTRAARADSETARAERSRRPTYTPPPLRAVSGVEELLAALTQAERGDSRAILVLQTAAYRIAKAVGELATALEGEVDAVLLTGALAAAGPIVAEVCRRVEWIAPVFLYREESDLRALAEGALRVLTGEEPAKRYA